MKCPKCGFDQPEDRFCANCGVDIALYTPDPKALSAFFKSGAFYVAFATTILGVGIWYLSTRERLEAPPAVTRNSIFGKLPRPILKSETNSIGGPSSMESRDESLEKPKSLDEKKPQTNPSAESPQNLNGIEVKADPAQKSLPKDIEAAKSQEPQGNPTPSNPGSVSKPQNVRGLRIQILEVDVEFEQILLGIGSGIDERPNIATVREEVGGETYSQRLKSGSEKEAVSKINSVERNLEDAVANFNFVSFDPKFNIDIGLSLELKVSQRGENQVLLVKLRRIFPREEGGAPESTDFQQENPIAPKTPVALTGLFRGRPNLDAQDLALYSSNPILSVYRSERFRNRLTSLVLIIEVIER